MDQSFAIVLEMVFQCSKKFLSFIVFFYLTVALFALLMMNCGTDLAMESDYEGMTKFLKYFFETYRNAIGDVKIYGYDKWVDGLDPTDRHQYVYRVMMISMVWILWLSNQLICMIILLNFLIAMVG